jgi:hypothetical protein
MKMFGRYSYFLRALFAVSFVYHPYVQADANSFIEDAQQKAKKISSDVVDKVSGTVKGLADKSIEGVGQVVRVGANALPLDLVPGLKNAVQQLEKLLRGLNTKNLTPEKIAQIVRITAQPVEEFNEVLMEPLIQLIKPLPMIPFCQLPPGIQEIPGLDIIDSMLALPAAATEFQIGLHIACIEKDFEAARRNFDNITSNKYRTAQELRDIAAHEQRRKNSFLRKLGITQAVKSVSGPVSQAVQRVMSPFDSLFKKIEKRADFLAKPIVELTTKIPMIPMLGPITTFQYIVHIRSLQQRMHRIEKILNNNLQPIAATHGEAITLKDMKNNAKSLPFAQALEGMMKPAQGMIGKVEKPIESLMQPLGTFPMWTSMALAAPFKALNLGMKLIVRPLLKYPSIFYGALYGSYVGAAGVAAVGLGASTAVSSIDQIIQEILFRTHIRNMQQMVEKLESAIESEQASRGIISLPRSVDDFDLESLRDAARKLIKQTNILNKLGATLD